MGGSGSVNKKQDSQCQTDIGLFEEYLARSRSERVGSSLRSRTSNGRSSEGAQRCGSDSSINSDEIFLSLPANNPRERRGLYKTSPIHGDRSPLLNESETPDKCYGNSLVATLEPYGHTIMSDHQDIPPRVKSVSPYHTKHDTNNINYNADIQMECKSTFLQNPSPRALRGSSDPVVQPNFLNGPYITDTGSASAESAYRLKPDGSALYGRRHSDNSPLIKISNPDRVPHRRYTTPNRKPACVDQSQTESSQPLLARHSADVCNSSPVYFAHTDRHSDNNLGSFLAPESTRGMTELPPEINVPTCAFTQNPLGAPSLNSLGHISNVPSPDSTISTGLSKLDEEEVSMISFHSYLKSRGVDLDMSSVQSSDV